MEGIAAPGRDRLTLTAGSSQIDFPASAPPSASTALSSWATEVGSVLVMDCFFWCYLLPPLPACFSPKPVFLPDFGSPDCPRRTSPLLAGAARGSLGWQLSQGTSPFFGGGAHLAASSSLPLIALPAFSSRCNFHPCFHKARASTEQNQAWEHRLALAAWHLCPPAWE